METGTESNGGGGGGGNWEIRGQELGEKWKETGRKGDGKWEIRGQKPGNWEKNRVGDSGKLENCTVLCNSKRGQLQGSQKFRLPCPTAFSPQSLFQLDTNSTC